MKPPKRPARPRYSSRPSRPPEPRLSWPPAPPEPPPAPRPELFQVVSFGPEVEKDFGLSAAIPSSSVSIVPDDEVAPEQNGTGPDGVATPGDAAVGGALGEGMAGKIYTGISWTLLSSFINQVLGLVRQVMLVRLLSLGDFGVAGAAGTVLGALCVLTNVGMSASTIIASFTSEQEKRRYVDTIWTIELARGFAIGVLMSLAALPTARFYHDLRLFPVVLVLAWIPFAGSLRNVGLGLTARDMQFGWVTIVGLAENVVGVGGAILLAWWLHSYWALVLAQLGAALFGLALSYLVHPYRSRLTFDREVFRQGLNFGKHIFLISASGFIVTTLDNIVVARVLGLVVLGTYVIAFSASSLLTNIVAQVMSTVFFPTFARIGRDSPDKLAPAATRAFTVATALLTVATAFLIALAPEFLVALFKAKALGAAGPLRVLAVAGFLRALVGLLSSILMGMNRPGIESRCKIIEGAVFIAAIYPLVHSYGMMGAAATGVLTFVVAVLLRFVFAQQAFGGALKSLLPLLGVSAVSIAGGTLACTGALAFLAVKSLSFLAVKSPWPRLLVGTPICMGVSALIFVILCPQMLREMKGMIAMVRQRFSAVATPSLP